VTVRGVVLDASAWINVLGTGHAERILGALRFERVVVDSASAEVTRHPHRLSATTPLKPMIDAGLVSIRSLNHEALATFVELVGAEPPNDLGDGEAATISFAHHNQFAAVLDERKARRVAIERFASIHLMSTIELLRVEEIVGELGNELPSAIYAALCTARMRVLASDAEWVLQCIGTTRARDCPSLRRWIRRLERPRRGGRTDSRRRGSKNTYE
jgi:predicted nucleic acid-binding protein